MPQELELVTHPSTAHSRRVRHRIEANGPVPSGMVIDVTCRDRLCIDLRHCILRKKKETHKYTEYRDRLAAMEPDEWFDIPDPPSGAREITKFRCGLHSICGLNKFLIRTWPSGRLQVIKIGTWSTYGRDGFISKTDWTTRTRKSPWQRPSQFFMGFMRNFGDLFWRPPKCKIRCCPYPTYRHTGEFCYQHNHWFDFNISMTDRGFSRATMLWTPRNKYMPWELAAEYLTKTENLEKSLIFTRSPTTTHNWVHDERHKNAGPTILETPKPIRRKLVSLDTGIENYSRSNGRLRMRLGGGSHHGSKTTAGRKCRASRGIGRRHSTKEKRWTRETIEALEREADELLGLDSPEVVTLADIMREEQANSLMAWGEVGEGLQIR